MSQKIKGENVAENTCKTQECHLVIIMVNTIKEFANNDVESIKYEISVFGIGFG